MIVLIDNTKTSPQVSTGVTV